MTTLVRQMRTSIKILVKNKANVLQTILMMPGKERNLDICQDNSFEWIDFKFVEGQRHYLFEEATSLEEALELWHWRPEVDEAGNIVNLTFTGRCDGDYDILFKQIAPWIEPGSFIEMVYEEGQHSRYFFHNGKMTEEKLKKMPGVDGHWDRFWEGKLVDRYVLKGLRLVAADVRRNLSLFFREKERTLQTTLQAAFDADIYLFAPQGDALFVFRIEMTESTRGVGIPLLYFICKI